MDTIDAIMARRSVRRYRAEPLPDGDLHTILEAGRQAPSAGNRQSWHFVVVRAPAGKQALAQACNGQMWLADAGALVVGVGKPAVNEKWHRVDVAIALENMVIAATALGYGTCWIGAFDPAQVKSLLGIPVDMEVLAVTPIGTPADRPEARPRMPLAEFASAEQYGQEMG